VQNALPSWVALLHRYGFDTVPSLRGSIRYAHYDRYGFNAVFSLRGSLCSTATVSQLKSTRRCRGRVAFGGLFETSPPVSTLFATFVATLRSDHFGFDAVFSLRGSLCSTATVSQLKSTRRCRFFYAAHIPGILGILQSLELQQYHPQHFLSQ
jgi:hypothetical protein